MGEFRSCFVSIIIKILLLLCLSAKRASAAPSEAQCRLERKLGINACKPVVYGKPPSADCCERVRVTDIECVCPVITPKLAALIDLNRAIRLVEGCGRRVPRHFKCGSITTP
ncbi:stamen-specific protein FIL1-like [Coffea eugenioides]|uniref:stamen-specific protein FIL1-like n=1 Tax=Coffea eugenioides TaxID=49369 RepID=UPI000F607623|nr:stamen-specific protein FIL1-like [Coffea eugenioides]